MKTCGGCGKTKPLSEFYRRGESGRQARCAECQVAKSKAWKEANPDRTRDQYKNKNLMKLYGISLAEYNEMFEDQKGRCAICEEHYPVLCVDHCHVTGRVRKLLCSCCNASLGQLRENERIVENLLNYIRRECAGGE
jgi:hypothetical protein